MIGLISFGFAVAMIPWRAFVLLKLWVWFLVPVWPMVAAPKWNIYGLALIASMLTGSLQRSKDKTSKDDWVYIAVASFIYPLLMLFTGWLVKAVCL